MSALSLKNEAYAIAHRASSAKGWWAIIFDDFGDAVVRVEMRTADLVRLNGLIAAGVPWRCGECASVHVYWPNVGCHGLRAAFDNENIAHVYAVCLSCAPLDGSRPSKEVS